LGENVLPGGGTTSSTSFSPYGQQPGSGTTSSTSFSPYGQQSGGGSYTTATGQTGSTGSVQTDGAGTANPTPRRSGGTTGTNQNQATDDTTRRGLRPVLECVTQAGNCPSQRDFGTACKCTSDDGRIYDGIVK
jgi:hypothetical protein